MFYYFIVPVFQKGSFIHLSFIYDLILFECAYVLCVCIYYHILFNVIFWSVMSKTSVLLKQRNLSNCVRFFCNNQPSTEIVGCVCVPRDYVIPTENCLLCELMPATEIWWKEQSICFWNAYVCGEYYITCKF